MPTGFILAAPHSGSGKTTVTLGLLRALKRRGIVLGPAKAGPDFIDPAFHAIAAGCNCVNLDPWAMRPDLIQSLAARQSQNGALIVEAMMGLFDGAADGTGSAADLAAHLSLPVVLVVDAAKQSHSIAALVSGFARFRGDISVAGVILNRVGSMRHEAMMREALAVVDMPVLGVVYRDEGLELPSRHLGLVQAGEHGDIERFINHAADQMEAQLDLDRLLALETPEIPPTAGSAIVPLGQKIAVAQDAAFAFCYPHILQGWRDKGAEILLFSPLADEAPDADADADAVYLPGGYPELHGERIANSQNFMNGLKQAATRGAFVYGECGGFMVLGKALIDGEGQRHEMAGLLDLVTSFEKRKLHLGYRIATVLADLPFASKGEKFSTHEFHYSTIVSEGSTPLFDVEDARGETLGPCGLLEGNVAGSYMHLIDRREAING